MKNNDKSIFLALFFSIFSAVIGVGIVVPLLPVYAHDLGANGFYIGLIFASFSISRTVLMPYMGRLSDKRGRKPFIICGLFGYSILSIAFIFSTSVNSLIIIRFIQGAASAMIMPVTQAYVGDIIPPGKEGLIMGLFNLSVFLGLSIGPFLGGVINTHLGLSTAFTCMGLLSLIGFLLSLTVLPSVENEKAVSKVSTPIAWQLLLKDRELIGLFLFRFAYTINIGIIWCFLPVFADTNFNLTSSEIGILVSLGVFVSGVMNTPMGFIADKINKRAMSCCGGLILVFAIFSFKLSGGFWDLFRTNFLFGIGGGTAMAPLMAMAVIKGQKTKSMGSVISILTVAHSLGMLTGSLLAGFAMDHFSLRESFPLGAVIMSVGIVALILLGRHQSE